MATEPETTPATPWYATAWGRRAILAAIVAGIAGVRLLYPAVAVQMIDCVVWAFGGVTLIDRAYVTFIAPAEKPEE